jgi:hypothetical protein
MTRIRASQLIALFALLGSDASPLRAGSLPQVGADPAVTVRLYALDPQAAPHLPRAIEEAGRIFDKAGVRVRWIECLSGEKRNPDCDTAPARRDIRLRVLPGKGGRQFDDALGYALALKQGDGVYANALFGAVTEVRRGTLVSTAQVLGHVIAHEIGHLLLGTVSHSRTGLMSAKWEHDELLSIGRREMGFSDEQTRRIRSAARARMLADATELAVAAAGQRLPADGGSAE